MASYTVKQGDSLIKLAKRLGVSTSSLLAANPGVSAITPGVTLRIPTAGPTFTDTMVPPEIQPPTIPTAGIPPEKWEQRPPPIPIPPRPTGIPPEKREQRPPRIQLPPPPRPPVSAGRLAPPPQYAPPAQSMAELEARRVRQPPVVGVTGAQRPIPQGQGPGLIPGALRVAEAIAPAFAPSIQKYLDRLFERYGTTPRQFGRDFVGSLLAPSRRTEPGQPPWQPQGLGEFAAHGLQSLPAAAVGALSGPVGQRQPSQPIVDITGAGRAQLLAQGTTQEVDPSTGVIWYRMTLADGTDSKMLSFGMSTEDVGPDGQLTDEAIDKYERQRADHVGTSWMRGEIPRIVLESDRLILGMSVERMEEIGYFWNEDKNLWEYGQQIEGPQVLGAAMPYGGWGYGGYGRGRGGRRAPSYAYPSGGGGTYKPYQPYQNLVRPDAQGRAPRQIQNRPGRFGMITWRI